MKEAKQDELTVPLNTSLARCDTEAAMTVICQVCRQTFLQTVREPAVSAELEEEEKRWGVGQL